MAHLRIRDDAIWANHIEGDDWLKSRILDLGEGETVELVVDGVVGSWAKMRNGRDGRLTNGLRPIGPMRDLWKRMQDRRGEVVPIRWVDDEVSYLLALRPFLEEWDTPEDDEAFRDLPSR